MVVFLLAPLVLATPTDSVDLRRALALARADRGVLTAAAAGVREAVGAWRSAGTVPNPVVALSYHESPPRRQVTIDQPLGWLGRRAADRSGASARIDRARADSGQLAADLDRAVRRVFYGALAAGERVAARRAQARLADSLVALGRRRVAAGDIANLELEQTIQEALRARLAADEAAETFAVARAALARTLGQPDPELLVPVGNLAVGLDDGAPTPPATIRDLPAIRAAVADSTAAATAWTGLRRSRLPLPALQVGVEWDDPTAAVRQSFLTLGAAFPLPLWNIGAGAIAAARAAADKAAVLTGEAELELTRMLREQSARIEHRARRARLGRDSLQPSAERLRSGTVAQYAAGRATVLAVFEALRSERDIILTIIDDLLAFQESRADFDALLGRSL